MARLRWVQALIAAGLVLAGWGCGQTTRDFTAGETAERDEPPDEPPDNEPQDGLPPEPAAAERTGVGAGHTPGFAGSLVLAHPHSTAAALPPETVVDGPRATIAGLPDCDQDGPYPVVVGPAWQALVSYSGRFASAADYTLSVEHPATVFFTDLDGDSVPELGLSRTDSLTFLHQDPAGRFTPGATLQLDGEEVLQTYSIFDLDGDGAKDVVLYPRTRPFSRELRVHFQRSDGFSRDPDQTVVVAEDPTFDCFGTYYLGVGDVTGDGLPDIVAESAYGRRDGSLALQQELHPSTEGMSYPVLAESAARPGNRPLPV
jgi:hypothetical protein